MAPEKPQQCPETWGIEKNIIARVKNSRGYDTVEMSSEGDRAST